MLQENPLNTKIMKTKIALSILAALTFASCSLANKVKHLQSSLIGLDRKITLYTSDGHVLREWKTRAQIEDRGGTVYFICDGKAVTVSGTFVVEEL